jgi:hypothetical protein
MLLRVVVERLLFEKERERERRTEKGEIEERYAGRHIER